ncbi:hypothetical protein BaRGS_00031483 [Batillaria attramentaria]|uniref:Antimicrobial peptide n=1 Tax=Batillaria attramentaria TaxID=370345 RepID=A0ABD0JRJ1_9CAEN
MRLQIFIFLFLFAAMFVTESEAGWRLRRTLKKVGKWIKENPDKAVAIAGAIGKRQTPSEDAVKEALAEALNGDGQLSEEEAAEFAKMLEVVEFCSDLMEAPQVH